MDPVVILLIVVISVITALLVVVGIHIIQLLREANRTVVKVNHTLEGINSLVNHLHAPFNKPGGLVEGLKIGLNLAQAFAHWLANVQTTADRSEEDDHGKQ